VKYAAIGQTDINVSAVCMGCWAIADPGAWGPQDEQDAIDAIEASLDAGVTFFDTAEGYGAGASEELLGRVLKPHRHRIVIATKAGSRHMAADDILEACDDSLRRLQTDHIDLYQLHWPSRNVSFEETAGALDTLVTQGKVRAVGVSNFGPLDLAAFLGTRRAEADQVAYSLLFRSPEYELLPVCAENRVSVLCYSSLAAGLLTGKFARADDVPAGRARTRHFSGDRARARHGEDGAEELTFAALAQVRELAAERGLPMAHVALAWLLRQEAVTSVIAGARNAAQARQNAAAAEIELPGDLVARLAEVTDPLKQKLGRSLDPWQSESRAR